MVDDFRGPKRPDIGMEPKAEEPSFAPPEAVAQQEEVIDMRRGSGKPVTGTNGSSNKNPLKYLVAIKEKWLGLTKKQKIIAGIAGLFLLVLIVGGVVMLTRKPAPKAAPVVEKIEEKVVEPPKPTTEPSKLTGVQVPIEYNLLPVTGIMIENSPDARPQSGLKDAGVVFEAVAEGGITRFLTLFQEAQPDYVGPVRSVRPYYLQWLQGFDAAVAHVGGSAEALQKIRSEGIKDLDQSFNGGPFQRVAGRYAPHNVYTSLSGLIALGRTKGYESSSFTGFPRKEEKPIVPPAARVIDLNISGPLYNVHYDYDANKNKYLRSMAGRPHTDEKTGEQIAPKVVIALVVPKGIHPNRIHTTYAAIGSGKAYIFQDGGVTEGTWTKGSDKEQIAFKDAAGAAIGLNPGQTWISIVGAAPNVTFAP